jgi:energy-coupling factor transporter ATP-binding protein EcfA2
MYIHRIQLKNIRGFETLDFSLRRPDNSYAGWTVFTGDNGSGKSTLLKALAVCLVGKDTARSLQPSFQGWIREGSAEGWIKLDIQQEPADDQLSAAGKPPASTFPVQIALTRKEKEILILPGMPRGKSSTYKTPDRTIWSPDAKGWFSCGYGPFRRVFGASPEASRLMVAPATERFVTMFHEAASLGEVDQWLRNLRHKVLENRESERKQMDLLMTLLREDLLPNEISVDRVDSDGLWLRDRQGKQLSWNEMSDGYRAALALLADIVRHLITAYGIEDLATKDDQGQTIIRRSGVVLIDEVDAHLHPEWQREIGFWLKRHFPRLQFIVTTHSPIICQAADPNGLFVLPEPGSGTPPRALTDEEYQKVVSSRPDTILLTPAFGLPNTRSPRAVESRAEWAALQAKKRCGADLTLDEQKKEHQLKLFVNTEEEG